VLPRVTQGPVARTASVSGAPAAQPGTKTRPGPGPVEPVPSKGLILTATGSALVPQLLLSLTEKGKSEPEEATLALAAMQPEYLPSCNTSDRLERLVARGPGRPATQPAPARTRASLGVIFGDDRRRRYY
jgi:hypothetical protein